MLKERKIDYFAVIVFVIALMLSIKISLSSVSGSSDYYGVDLVVYVLMNLFIGYVVGVPLSFFMAKSHIVSAQYFWRWANIIALLVIFLMFKGATQ